MIRVRRISVVPSLPPKRRDNAYSCVYFRTYEIEESPIPDMNNMIGRNCIRYLECPDSKISRNMICTDHGNGEPYIVRNMFAGLLY